MKERYAGIDGLKAYSILGIVIMHVLANGNYSLNGFFFSRFIPSMADLVFVFMMVSAFGMCCGYYKKILHQEISIEDFYRKRYSKMWPFFALLCLVDFIISPSLNALYEVFANLTLCQGLLPNMDITVIGVSWTLAVIFVFYLLFPFFCYLLSNKKRAWLTLLCTVIYNFACTHYFFNANHIAEPELVHFLPRSNILFCAIYFVVGGMIYLYRKDIVIFVQKERELVIGCVLIFSILYFLSAGSTWATILFSSILLIYTLGCKKGILINKGVKFLGKISFEIYLCHMVVFRVLEKLHLIHIFQNELINFLVTTIIVIIGSIVFSICTDLFIGWIKKKILSIKKRYQK